MKVGLLTASISRLSGGLLSAMSPLAAELASGCADVEVFAGRDAFTDSDLAYWTGVSPRLFATRPPRFLGYMPRISQELLASDLDVLHSHGIWTYPSIAASIWRKRTGGAEVISPHGMLDAWALKNSSWKKRIAGWGYENRHLHGASCIHALCAAEYQSIRDYGLTNPVAIIPNGVDLPDKAPPPGQPLWAADVPVGQKVVLFLGRLHPKKGLSQLLKAWSTLAANGQQHHPWHLVVAGWDQQGYRIELERLSVDLGISRHVHFVGPVYGDEKAASFAFADAFVLPSFSEGLPMAILEAWAYEMPVLMTPHCNIPEGFEAAAAICMEPEPDDIAHGLRQLFALSDVERQALGERGRTLVEKRFSWDSVAGQMCDVYKWLLGDGPKPPSVVES